MLSVCDVFDVIFPVHRLCSPFWKTLRICVVICCQSVLHMFKCSHVPCDRNSLTMSEPPAETDADLVEGPLDFSSSSAIASPVAIEDERALYDNLMEDSGDEDMFLQLDAALASPGTVPVDDASDCFRDSPDASFGGLFPPIDAAPTPQVRRKRKARASKTPRGSKKSHRRSHRLA